MSLILHSLRATKTSLFAASLLPLLRISGGPLNPETLNIQSSFERRRLCVHWIQRALYHRGMLSLRRTNYRKYTPYPSPKLECVFLLRLQDSADLTLLSTLCG